MARKKWVAVDVVWCHCEADAVRRHCEAWNKPWQSHTLYVILSVTKDLKACTTDHRHGDLEILHFVQNDNIGQSCAKKVGRGG